MTQLDIRNQYAHDSNGRITDPGKFEGEPIFAPFFWDLGLSGLADEDNGSVYTFRLALNDGDKELAADWPELKVWLGRSRTLKLQEDSQGFVHCF